MQEWIEKLKLVDARFAEAGWLPEYEYRKYLAEVIDGLEQALQQADVSGSLPRMGDKIWCIRKINGGKMCGRLCEGCDQWYTMVEKVDYEARKKSANDR